MLRFAILFTLALCVQTPVFAQLVGHRTVTTDRVNFGYPVDSLAPLQISRWSQEAQERGSNIVNGCYFGSVKSDSAGTYVDVTALTIEDGCERSPDMVGLFAVWPFPQSPVGDPLAAQLLEELADAFLNAVVVSIPYAVSRPADSPYPLMKHLYLVKVAPAPAQRSSS